MKRAPHHAASAMELLACCHWEKGDDTVEWLNKYKKIIISFCMSFAILGCSVLTPFMEVGATELEETRIQDLNGDGRITFDEWGEQSISRLSLAFTMIGVCFGNPTSYVALADRVAESQAYQDFLAKNEPAELVVGYLTDDNFFYFSDGTFDMCENFLKESRASCGFTLYPALDSSKYYWYQRSGASFSDSNFNSFISTPNFEIGMPVSYDGTYYYFPVCRDYYYDQVVNNTLVLVDTGSDIDVYSYDGSQFISLNIATTSYSKRYKLGSGVTSFSTSSWSTDKGKIAPSDEFLGLVGTSSVVFDGLESAYAYYSFNRELFESNNNYKSKLPLDTLNSTDWEAFNKNTYDAIYDAITDTKEQNGSLTDPEAQAIIDSYFSDIIEALGAIQEGQFNAQMTFDQILQQLIEDGERQSTWLSKIYDLLEKWLPNIGKGGDTNIDVDINTEEDDNKVNDFATNSDGQSNSLNDLNQQTDYEKVDVDSASTEVDENVDLEAVGSYGTLLSSVTSNEYVIYILLATLSIALVSYILFGKR